MKIGIYYTNGDFYSKFGEDKFLKIKEHGYSCVDYNISDTTCGIYKMSEEEAFDFARHERALADAAGIEISQVHGPWTFPDQPDGTEEGRKKRFEECVRSIRFTAQLGCENWVIHPIFPFGADDLDKGLNDATMELNVDFYTRLLEYAEQEGVTICIENMPFHRFSLSKPADILELVKKINHKNFKICLDTGHIAIFDGMMPDDAVRLFGDYLQVLHIHDTFPGDDRHMIPRFGIINWEKFAKALREINFDGVFSLETHPSKTLSPRLFEETAKLMFMIAEEIIN